MPEITTYELKTAFAPLEKFDHLAKSDDFIEVSLWHNGEFKALKKLIKELDG